MSQKILIFDEKFNHISLELYIIEINNIKNPKFLSLFWIQVLQEQVLL